MSITDVGWGWLLIYHVISLIATAASLFPLMLLSPFPSFFLVLHSHIIRVDFFWKNYSKLHLFLFKWNFYVSPNYFSNVCFLQIFYKIIRIYIDQILWNLIPIEYFSVPINLADKFSLYRFFYRSYTFLLDKIDRHQMDHKNQFLSLKINLLNRAHILLLHFFYFYFASQFLKIGVSRWCYRSMLRRVWSTSASHDWQRLHV